MAAEGKDMFRTTTVSKKPSLLKTDTSDLLWKKPLPQFMGIIHF